MSSSEGIDFVRKVRSLRKSKDKLYITVPVDLQRYVECGKPYYVNLIRIGTISVDRKAT